MGVKSPPAVGYDRDEQREKPLCTRCKKTGKELYHFYRDCPLGGRQHPPTSAAAFCVPIDEEDAEGVHALAMCAVFQEAADDGAEAFARAATAYGPPAVLCGGVVGGIDVSAYGFSVAAAPPVAATSGDDILQRLDDLAAEVNAAVEPKAHYTHASFPPPEGVESQTSALVCGPAEAGITPEEQVPAGGAAASASAVPAPAMPVLENEKELLELYGYGSPVSLQSTRTAASPSSRGLRPSRPMYHASEPAARVPESGGASRTYGCSKPPWGFPAHAGPWEFPSYFLSLILFISIMGVGAAAYTAANDIDSVQVSGRAAPQPVLCRGDLCIYPGISELDPVTLDAVLHSLGAATVAHRPPDPLESSDASYYRGHWGDGAPLDFDPD
ncbi:hypothetical protein CYMTET_13720 [Cymbomonas tetramitiformis]|uniref:Uncharacterized protein n=1 Tax=Cymbomonas tetramitiformis TaxID=36881 RepID=A0AAE0GHT3_9CHLO|nr:hypothetical protein CYMTET_13720 [Cymbomonas tetramitiformis]